MNLLSVKHCSVLNWVELRRLASNDRLFGRISVPDWMLVDFNNSFKCRRSGKDQSNLQLKPWLWNLSRPVIKGTKNTLKVPAWSETYGQVKEPQKTWLVGSSPLTDRCPQSLLIRRMLLKVTNPLLAPRLGAAQNVKERSLRWSEGMEPRILPSSPWKKTKAVPSRKPEVSAGHWKARYSRADDQSRQRWLRR